MHTPVRFLTTTLMLYLAMTAFAFADEIVVIVNLQNTQALDKNDITRIYLGKTGNWKSGHSIDAIDFPEDSMIHDEFYSRVLGKSPALVKTIWAQNIFTGKRLPPHIVSNSDTIKQLVHTNLNAIGYIHASEADDSIRIIKLPGEGINIPDKDF